MVDEVSSVSAAPPAAAPTEAAPSTPPTTAASAPVGESSSPGSVGTGAASATEASTSSTSTSPSEAAPTTGAAPAAAPKPANEFQPSLLDGAAATDSAPKADKPADAGPTEAPGETPLAPVKYEFTYPEGYDPAQVNAERMNAYTGILGEAKVSKESGQKLLDLHLQELQAAVDKNAQHQWDVFNETQKTWRDQVMADPELGGDKHGKAISTIMSLVDLYGGNAAERQGLLDAFRITGAANNPHVLRFMHRAAQSIAKEAPPTPAPPPRMPQPNGRERGLSRYGNTTPFQG